MDLEWLLPQQIEKILNLCELSNMDDLTAAANILQTNKWDLEVALNQIVEQNDDSKKKQLNKQISKASQAILNSYRQQGFKGIYEEDNDSEMCDVDEGFYPEIKVKKEKMQIKSGQFGELEGKNVESLEKIQNQRQFNYRALIKSEQNNEYEEMEKQFYRKKQEEKVNAQKIIDFENQLIAQRTQFENQGIISDKDRIEFKFRMPVCGTNCVRAFSRKDKVKKLFDYISCFQRDQFEDRYSEFDLTQTFPNLSLKSSKNQIIEEVFGDSLMELLIIKEL